MGPLHTLLQHMPPLEASDLFLSAGRTPALRIHGRLTPLEAISGGHPELVALCRPFSSAAMEQIVRELLTPAQREAFAQGHEINVGLALPGGGRFRCAVFRQRRTPALAVRSIPREVPACADLGLPPALVDLVFRPAGLILVTGPTGAGKSTTLAALLQHRAEHDACHIMTLEDPVEYHLQHGRSVVNQREIGSDTSSYAAALKGALRQSPDVLMIGEIRDRETLEQAMAFADTGHLCLATVHANRVPQAIDRLLHLYPEHLREALLLSLSLNLQGAAAQRLVPARDGGRVAAFELLLNTPHVAELLRRARLHALDEAMERGATHGMQTLDQSLYNLAREGHIDAATAHAHATARRHMHLRLRLAEDADGR